jgi:DNA repair ATPase RecN
MTRPLDPARVRADAAPHPRAGARQNAAEIDGLRQRVTELECERNEAQEHIKKLAARIHKQRVALRENWEIIEIRASYPRRKALMPRMLQCAIKHNQRAKAAEARAEKAERERDEARAEVERLTAVNPHTGQEIADLALKWAVAGWMSHTPEVFKAEQRKFEHHVLTAFCACARPYKARAEAVEARLAQARSTIETAMDDLQAALVEGSGLDRIMGQLECAVACCDGELLARDTGTGGGDAP